MNYWVWVGCDIVLILLFGYVSFLPFHKGFWSHSRFSIEIGKIVKDRFNALFYLNFGVLTLLMITLSNYLENLFWGIIISLIYYVISIIILTYPKFKRKSQNNCNRLWEKIDDWYNTPPDK